MNIVLVSDDHREAERLKAELCEQASVLGVEIAPNTQNALFRHIVPDTCDTILLDESVPNGDAANLIVAIRNEKKPIGVVALVGANEKELPTDLYYAGVDRFVVKRDGYIPILLEALREAKDRHRVESAHHPRQVRLFYAGDTEVAKRHLSSLPHLVLEPLKLDSTNMLQMPDLASFPGDAIVVDCALTGSRTLETIKDISLHAPELSTILLTQPEDEDIAFQAMELGAADCIAKTSNYFQKLLPVIVRELGRRQLAREKAAYQSKEARLRQILEIMPVGIVVIAPDGTFLAANQIGIKLMGATRLEQIVGKNLIQLVPEGERQRTLDFLTTISQWMSAFISLNWKGPDGTVPCVELRAVPMRRENMEKAAALAAIYPSSVGQINLGAAEESNREDSQEQEQRFRDLQEKYAQQELQLAAALQQIEDLNLAAREQEAKDSPELARRFRELQEKFSLQQSLWDASMKQAEARRASAEEQQTKLERAAQKAAARLKLLIEEQRTEQLNWKQSYDSLKERYDKLEETVQNLKAAQAPYGEINSAEMLQWGLQHDDLDS
jgi:PAS domain S-box-containing protein